jgi:peptidoglycan/LPS O-acetylase OafA/YrhL
VLGRGIIVGMDAQSSARHPQHFPLLDALRAFAALSVVIYHFIAHWDWSGFPASGPLAWFRSGWMAVDIFFVISGFVIGLSAFARLDAQGTRFRAGFMRSRLARIAPLHVVTLMAYIALVEPSLVRKSDFWPDLVAHLLFLHNLSFDWHGAINGPNWSLAAEMQFYALVLLIAPWLAKARPWKIALLFVSVAWAWRWGAFAMLIPGSLDKAYMAQTQLPGMLDEFAIGLLLARFVRADAGRRFLDRLRNDVRMRWVLAGAAALCWWALFDVFNAHDYWAEAPMAVFFRTALASCAALVLLLLCAWPMPKMRAAVAVPLYLGKVSYGIYLWHVPVLFFLGAHTRLEPALAFAVALPATVGMAALTWHFVEKPFTAGARWLPRARAMESSPAVSR